MWLTGGAQVCVFVCGSILCIRLLEMNPTQWGTMLMWSGSVMEVGKVARFCEGLGDPLLLVSKAGLGALGESPQNSIAFQPLS